MTIFRRYRKGDPDAVATHASREGALLSIDPGAQGVALCWADGLTSWPSEPTWRRSIGMRASGFASLAEKAASTGVRIVLIEDQFLGKNVASLTALAFNAGMVVGHVLDRCLLVDEVVHVPPWAWQRRLPKTGGNSKDRARANVVRQLSPEWLHRQGDSSVQEAVADAFCIADWFKEVTSGREVRVDPVVRF